MIQKFKYFNTQFKYICIKRRSRNIIRHVFTGNNLIIVEIRVKRVQKLTECLLFSKEVLTGGLTTTFRFALPKWSFSLVGGADHISALKDIKDSKSPLSVVPLSLPYVWVKSYTIFKCWCDTEMCVLSITLWHYVEED